MSTGFDISGGFDLSGIFQPYSGLQGQASLTNFKTTTSDLNGIFEPLIFTITGTNYQTCFNATADPSNQYIITFLADASFTYIGNKSSIGINCFIVGGGGAGGSSSLTSDSCGGGGGGGGEQNLFLSEIIGNVYIPVLPRYIPVTITVGSGGSSSSLSGNSTTISFDTYSRTVNGGGGGGNANVSSGGIGGIGGRDGSVGSVYGGNGGNGGYFTSYGIDASNGISQIFSEESIPNSSGSTTVTYYFGGGGGGGSFAGQVTSSYGGLGGGEGGGIGVNGNDYADYYGPNGIYYPKNSVKQTYPNSGGGGAGGNGNNSSLNPGKLGNSGICVIWFSIN